jgi:hypothetical protein
MGSPISSTGFTNFWVVCFALADAKHSLNGLDRRLRHTPSQSSLHSEGSSRPPPPADPTRRRKDEEEAIHERERNPSLRQQKWTNAYTRKQAASPNPTASYSRVRTNSEPDPSAPAGSALTRPPNGLLKGPPAGRRLSSRHSAPPPPKRPNKQNATKLHAFRCRHPHNQNPQTDTPTTNIFVSHRATLVQTLPYQPLL